MPCLRAQPCVFLDPSFGCLQMSSVIPMSSLHIESTSQTKKPSDAYCRKLCSASAFASSAASCRIICIASAFASSLAMCLILNCSYKDPYDNRYQCRRCVDDPARQTQPTSAFIPSPEMAPAVPTSRRSQLYRNTLWNVGLCWCVAVAVDIFLHVAMSCRMWRTLRSGARTEKKPYTHAGAAGSHHSSLLPQTLPL